MTTFLFVRHSITTGGAGDPGLSIPGRELARVVGADLRDRRATYVFSSPLRRACQTAREIALVLGLEVLVDERLRESTNWGDVPDESFERFLERWDARDARATRTRMSEFVDDASRWYPRATLIVVAHGGIVGDYLGGHEEWPHCGVSEFAA